MFLVPWKFPIRVVLSRDVVLKVEFLDKAVENFEKPEGGLAEKLCNDHVAYFSGERVEFDYKVSLKTEFMRRVLNEVRKVGYGETTTYGEIARKLNTSPRAVGQALKANPAPVIIPCHRVLAKGGLGGFSQGLNVKRELLRLEGVLV